MNVVVTLWQIWPPLAAMGQSQQMQCAPKSVDVRFDPIATVSYQNVIYHNGPNADLSNCSKSARYSITSSARPSNDSGTSRPIAFAVLRLIAS